MWLYIVKKISLASSLLIKFAHYSILVDRHQWECFLVTIFSLICQQTASAEWVWDGREENIIHLEKTNFRSPYFDFEWCKMLSSKWKDAFLAMGSHKIQVKTNDNHTKHVLLNYKLILVWLHRVIPKKCDMKWSNFMQQE